MPEPRRHLAAIAALCALVLYAVSANIVFAAQIRAAADFAVTPIRLANASAWQFGGFFLASLIGGLVADRVGKTRVLAVGSALVAAGAGIWAASGSLAGAFAGGVVMGAGGGILEGMSSALLADLFPKRRKFFLNISQMAYCLGAVGGPAAMGRLLPLGVSWRWFFAGTAAGGVVLLVLFALSHAPRPQRQEHSRGFPLHALRASVLLPALLVFLYVLAEMGTATFMNTYLREGCAAPESWAIYALSIFWAAMVAGRALCALLPESVPEHRVVSVLMLLSGIGLLAQAGVESWTAAVACFAFTGFAFSGIWPLIVAMTASRNPHGTGVAVGVTVACGSLGCVVAPPLFGRLIAGAEPADAFVWMAAILFVGALLSLAAGRIMNQPPPQSDDDTMGNPNNG